MYRNAVKGKDMSTKPKMSNDWLEKLLTKHEEWVGMKSENGQCRIEDVIIEEFDFSSYNLSEAVFHNVTFKDCAFGDTRLWAAAFITCEFSTCHFAGAEFWEATIAGSTFNGCSMIGVDLQNAKVANCTFNKCRFLCAQFRTATLANCQFNWSKFSSVDFTDAKLNQVNFNTSFLPNVEGLFIQPDFEANYSDRDLRRLLYRTVKNVFCSIYASKELKDALAPLLPFVNESDLADEYGDITERR